MKNGRNDPCPCGSGNKYKKCCLPKDEAARAATLTAQAAARAAAEPAASTAESTAGATGAAVKPPAPKPTRAKAAPVAPPLFRRRAV